MILIKLLDLYKFLLIIRILMSWVQPDPHNPLVRFLYAVTDPILNPLRKIIPPIGGTIDISPIFAFLLIEGLKMLIAGRF